MTDAPTLHFADHGDGVAVDLPKLIASRMLIQANSGGGKSWAVRYILEQTHGQVQQLVIDTEGEFASLREQFDYILAGSGGDLPANIASAKLLCRRLVELGASAVVDIYDLSMPDRRRFVKLFLDELMHLPKKLWRPLLVVIDEAHRYAPETGKSEAAEQVQALCSQGRKRGFCAVLVTQRLSKLSKDAAAELLNKLIGRTHLDVDVQRAGDDLGFDKKQRQRLKSLHPGEFYVYGPAIGREVTLVRTGVPSTTHPEPGKVAPAPPPPPEAVQKLIQQLDGIEEEAAEEERTVEDLKAKSKQLKRELAAARAELRRLEAQDAGVSTAELEAARDAAFDEGRATGVRDFAAILTKEVAGVADVVERNRAAAEEFLEGNGGGTTSSGRPQERAQRSAVPREQSRGAARRASTKPTAASNGDESLSEPHRKILAALLQLEELGHHEPSNGRVAVVSGYAKGSGTFSTYLSQLSTAGLIERLSGSMRLTDAGRAAAPAEPSVASLQELHERALSRCPGDPHRKILQALLAAWPDETPNDELAAETGYTPGSGTFSTYLSRLSSLGLIERNRGAAKASDLLFPEGLY